MDGFSIRAGFPASDDHLYAVPVAKNGSDQGKRSHDVAGSDHDHSK
jgi:hypothetical protein